MSVWRVKIDFKQIPRVLMRGNRIFSPKTGKFRLSGSDHTARGATSCLIVGYENLKNRTEKQSRAKKCRLAQGGPKQGVFIYARMHVRAQARKKDIFIFSN